MVSWAKSKSGVNAKPLIFVDPGGVGGVVVDPPLGTYVMVVGA